MPESTDHSPDQPTPVHPEWLVSQQEYRARTEPWPEGVIARYLTTVGATVDLRGTRDSASYKCWGCDDSTALYGERRTRELAQDHAEKCRALPRPAANA
jgi:hypothetical protein